MHVIAAEAVAFGEALQPAFRAYAKCVVENVETLAETLAARGFQYRYHSDPNSVGAEWFESISARTTE